MNKYFYDLHIHSCLSPCGDEDMTPNNIAGMAVLKNLNIVALTDHNTCGNCPAFFDACKKQGIIAIAGMELTTSEDIHLVCLFEELEQAIVFSREVEKHRIIIKNRVDIFGEQIYTDSNDNITGYEESLLPNATDLDVNEAYKLAVSFGAFVYPAHIDRQANGLISTLGTFPEEPVFNCAEFHDKNKIVLYKENHPMLSSMKTIISSDAHYLWDINEAENYFTLDDTPYSSAKVRKELFKYLNEGTVAEHS